VIDVDAFLTIVGTGAMLVVFALLSIVLGTDSRDDYTERTLHPSYR
jgi:hypothetical protein